MRTAIFHRPQGVYSMADHEGGQKCDPRGGKGEGYGTDDRECRGKMIYKRCAKKHYNCWIWRFYSDINYL